jgi:hypothetical protein
MGIAINLSIFSSQSTTKQAFSVGGIYHVTVRLSLEPDRHFLGKRTVAIF